MEVELVVALPQLAQADAERLCAEAVRFCPFHQALHGNADATMVVSGGVAAAAAGTEG
jgi:organic hydroperoxide reductase OsmC/OhrA